MAAKVIWSPSSLGDIEAITAFIAADNPSAALKVGRDLISTVERLGAFPGLGHPFREKSKPGLHEFVSSHYRIIYRLAPDEKSITILRIWHGARGRPQISNS